MLTIERRQFLAERIEEAAKIQPEILDLRKILLLIGGAELVAPPRPDPDIATFIADGSRICGPARLKLMTRGACHENAAKLWLRGCGVCGIGTGYALSDDGLWRQHSWAMGSDGVIIETTELRSEYFGRVLRELEADMFACSNLSNQKELHRAFRTGTRRLKQYADLNPIELLASDPTSVALAAKVRAEMDRNAATTLLAK